MNPILKHARKAQVVCHLIAQRVHRPKPQIVGPVHIRSPRTRFKLWWGVRKTMSFRYTHQQFSNWTVWYPFTVIIYSNNL